MLRPATPDAIRRLHHAVDGDDPELDRALTMLGVLPPMDLEPIRAALRHPSAVVVPETNRDGHRRLVLQDRHGYVAWIEHDGSVQIARPCVA